MSKELGQNIIYNLEGVARARRNDLLLHLNSYAEGIRTAREQGDIMSIRIFTDKYREVKAELDWSFPLNSNSNSTDGSF